MTSCMYTNMDLQNTEYHNYKNRRKTQILLLRKVNKHRITLKIPHRKQEVSKYHKYNTLATYYASPVGKDQ